MADLQISWFVLFWAYFSLFHATLAEHEEVLQIHFPSVTVSAQKDGYLAAQTEEGGDIHINHKGNGTRVYLEDINLTKIIKVVQSLPPLWMNHTDTGYSGKFEGGKHFQIPLNVLVPGAENISFEIVAGSLPPGVYLDAANRRISGISPDEDAQYIFTVRAKTEYGKFADAVFRFDSYELDQCEEYPCHNNGVCNNTREGMGFTCICVEHYGGKQCDTDCRLNSIGVGNENVIPDAQLSAYLSRDLSLATQARFHDSSSGWCGENDNSWIQVDTGAAGRIFAVTTKAGRSDQFLQTFTLSCSLDGTQFSDVLETNSTTAYVFSSTLAGITQPLPEPASCRFIRLHPKTYKIHPCLMLELHGCVP
ncbi:coagulation factor VIII-like [Crassostrea virginica]